MSFPIKYYDIHTNCKNINVGKIMIKKLMNTQTILGLNKVPILLSITTEREEDVPFGYVVIFLETESMCINICRNVHGTKSS